MILKLSINMKKKIVFIVWILFSSFAVYSQITTSSLSGIITTSNEKLSGATIKVTHIPSGTVWGAISNQTGYYNIQGLRVGGPYAVEVSYVGFKTQTFSGINIPLGEVYILDVSLEIDFNLLETFEITEKQENYYEKVGGTTKIKNSVITSLPTIERSVDDIIKLSPHAGKNNSFAGIDARYNNVLIDGASFKNGYGMSSKLTSGGDNAQPFSLDAIEEISVNIAPFDVRQSQFTGANINLVTRSGDNTFKGSVYSFLRPKSLTGNLVGDEVVENANLSNYQLYGMRLGGPIIKNKLFFFVSGEYEVKTTPGNEWTPSENGIGNSSKKISRASTTDLALMKSFLNQQYDYDAGNYQDNNSLNSNNYKILARLDWNINTQNKFSLRYNEVHSESDQLVNNLTTPIGNLVSGRNSISALSFSNSNYRFVDIIRSITGELNSTFKQSFSNKFLVNYSHIRSTRNSNSDLFPFVDIWKDGEQYMSFGYEPFSYGTDLTNNVFEVSDNLSYYVGKHTFTAGLSFNYMSYLNNYRMYGLGYYRYDSPEDFYLGNTPSAFALTYGYDEDQPMFKLNFGLGSFYLQDEWRINERFMLTYGARFEMPFYFNKLKDNSAIDSLVFADGYQMDVGSWPKSSIMISPRAGFKWTLPTEKIGIDLRGGSGIFSGLMPFVWLNEQPSLSGVIQNTVVSTSGQIPFTTDYHSLLSAYPELFPSNSEGAIPSTFVEVDKKFKLPMIWRTNLTFNFDLPADFVFTVEGLYSKELQSVIQKNINEKTPNNSFSGSDNRDSWWDENGNADNKINQNVKYALLVTNAQQGYQYSITTQLSKKLSYGLSGSIAYTYNVAKNLSDNYGVSAKSRLLSNVSVNSLNNLTLSYSGYSIPHRIVGSVTYRIEDKNHLAFSVALLYQGSAQGRYSFIYANDMNGDGNASDLIYIPQSATDIVFAETSSMTASEQQNAFWNFVLDNKYLNNNRGNYAERNGYVGPWVNRFDMKLLQDIFTNFGTEHRYTMQLSLDILNIGNLLNSNWGTYKIHGYGNSSGTNIYPLKYAGTNENNESTYVLNASGIEEFNENAQWFKNVSTGSTWGCLIGLRLLF